MLEILYVIAFKEKEKYNKLVDNSHREKIQLSEQLQLEMQRTNALQMEIDAKESEKEQLEHKLAMLANSDNVSVNSLGTELDQEDGFMGRLRVKDE